MAAATSANEFSSGTVASAAKLGRPTEEYSEYFEGGRPKICGAQQVPEENG